MSDNVDTLELLKKINEKKMLLKQAADSIQVKKLNKDEKDKVRRAIKKRKQKLKKKGVIAVDDKDLPIDLDESDIKRNAVAKPEIDPDVQIEYVEKDEYLLTGKYYEEFKHVFQAFSQVHQALPEADQENNEDQGAQVEGEEEENDGEEKQLSKKQRKLKNRKSIAELKALVRRPDLVEQWDTTARDPEFLLSLKSIRNSVPVPNHWNQKRRFLQNKRGVLKPPFKLPEHIESTGITKLRDPFNDKDAGRNVRQKLRERMNPKLGKIDIDYEVLHDAFFKNNKKPHLSIHGDVYHEGKDDEAKMKNFKPGKLSDELRDALGISATAPPPWLSNMQRFGAPPSYPNLRIPGLNVPFADGSFPGFTRLDENGQPIFQNYGNGFYQDPESIDKALWGELAEEEYEEEIEVPEYTEDIEAPPARPESELRSGVTSIIGGMDTPESFELQKKSRFSGPQSQQAQQESVPKPLYQVLETVDKNVGSNIYGSAHGYVIPGSKDQKGNQQ